jgi:hypothetical protein
LASVMAQIDLPLVHCDLHITLSSWSCIQDILCQALLIAPRINKLPRIYVALLAEGLMWCAERREWPSQPKERHAELFSKQFTERRRLKYQQEKMI